MQPITLAHRPIILTPRPVNQRPPQFEGNLPATNQGISARKLRATLKTMIRNPKAVLESLQKATPEILSIPRMLGRNQANIGVFEVETAQGIQALKVYGEFEAINVKKSNYTGIMIQKLLGDLGYMPKIHGFVPRETVSKLAERFPALKERVGGFGHDFAVLMDKVDGFQLTRMDANDVPEGWRKSEILQRAQTIENTLDSLKIKATDEAWMVDRQGKLWMVDSDRCSWYNTWGKEHGVFANYGNSTLKRMARLILMRVIHKLNPEVSENIANFLKRLQVKG